MTARILVVDDEPDVEQLVAQKFRRQVRRGEMHFLFARDGKQALDTLKEEKNIAMVLSDINMPRMDGLSLLNHLREDYQDLQTVIVSAYGDMKNIRTAMNRGAFDFVTKPIELDDLETTIEKTLDHARRLSDLETARKDAERASAAFERYFSPSVAEALRNDPEFNARQGERRFMTFLFTDLAGFTSFVEATAPDVVMAILNKYLDEVSRIVFKHDGTIMKIVGDAVHVMFGAPLEHDDDAARAVDCALEIDAFAEKFRERLAGEGTDFGATRIGVNSGDAIVGNFGGGAFFDYTAHGEAINIAARLEAANKQIGSRICVSENTVSRIPGFSGRPIGKLLPRGMTEHIMTYEPFPAETAASDQIHAYQEAFETLASNSPEASQAFAGLIGTYGEDHLAMFHLKRLLDGEKGIDVAFADEG
ncbi:MAG: response regulator [Hyphomicrobiales bacterium]